MSAETVEEHIRRRLDDAYFNAWLDVHEVLFGVPIGPPKPWTLELRGLAELVG